ncbi:MAG TPA: HlyD family efflux transporter periplasmic adaptor subunit, partial [Kofleriaceae bacterium]|nr:HlyD family efflux transporter periplasmic adaptor subunit [Kofleriaceae bacterium]
MTTRDEPASATLRSALDDQERRRRRASRRKRIRWAKRIGIGLVALGAAAAIARALVPRAVPVDVAEARRGELTVYLEEDGRTRVRERYLVSAPISGELVRVEVEPGDRLEEGAVVARVVQPPAQLLDERSRAETESRLAGAAWRERQARTAALRAAAAAELAAREEARVRALAGQGVVPVAERDRADAQAEVARQDLAGARLAARVAAAEVEMVRAALGQLKRRDPAELAIRAPAAGRVLRVHRESAGAIAAGTPIVEVGEPRSVEAVIDVLSSEAVKVKVGAPVSIEEWGGGQPLAGRVR